MNIDKTEYDTTPADAESGGSSQEKVMKCEDIQSVLFDYMSRELGPSRSELVREHLRKCPACKEVAADIQSTLDLMRRARADAPDVVTTLSDDHRNRMSRAVAHPFLHWVDQHHILVSVAVAVVALLVLACALRRARTEPDAPVSGQTFLYHPEVGWVRSDTEDMEGDDDNSKSPE